MFVATEKTTSLPMLCLSGHTSKEAYNEHSRRRAQSGFVFISSGIGLGHEGLSHGPLFSSLEGLDRRPRRKGARRWSLSHLHFTALLMIYTTDEALKDRFESARTCVIEMFPGRRRPGRTYQGFVKAQPRGPGCAVGGSPERWISPSRLEDRPRLASQEEREAARNTENPCGYR